MKLEDLIHEHATLLADMKSILKDPSTNGDYIRSLQNYRTKLHVLPELDRMEYFLSEHRSLYWACYLKEHHQHFEESNIIDDDI